MPISPYGVLSGRATRRVLDPITDTSPHYKLYLRADGVEWEVPINVLSKVRPYEVEYLVVENFQHPILDGMLALPEGFTALRSEPDSFALDYVRSNLFDRADMRPLPFTERGDDNDLYDKLDFYLGRAMRANTNTRVFAFGEKYSRGRGVHDIHMNQGSTPDYARSDGVYQDGAVLIYDATQNRWVAIFLKFQSQVWETHPVTGLALTQPPPIVVTPPPTNEPVTPPVHPPPTQTNANILIIAALVNPLGGGAETETITLINPTPRSISLEGWQLQDKESRTMSLSGMLDAGEVKTLVVIAPMALSNKGGTITLVDANGTKVHGVSYTGDQARRDGWTIVF